FGVCGGCSMQHLDFNAQIHHKQKVLIDNLKHIGGVTPRNILPSILGVPWGYRHKARFSVRYVHKKDSVLVGFRERGASYVANMNECHVVPEHTSNLIPQFRDLIYNLTIRDKIPQIEVSVGDDVSVFVFRIMSDMMEKDSELIHQFVREYNQDHTHPIQIWLQPQGIDSCYLFAPQNDTKYLSYTIDALNITKPIKMPYYPTEFTQVNPYVNSHMVNTAIKLLDLQPTDNVFDFFCGIGNFTLPIATMCQNVTGIEGNESLVKRAFENAKYNNLENNTHYMATNLFTVTQDWLISLGKRNKWLIDPPRDGAMELIKSITPNVAPDKIIYVSCNPSTLARDASILVNTHG
ncbi:23S rRNA (uracil(1939)-C(5))-methyltransferase RlmD, partial [bacterium]|nr:23S rRNA (uracil(1939)-C(5))-methyltransferase RlmD [Candidatus Elulimicrobium humile]